GLAAFAPFLVLKLIPLAEGAMVAHGISRSPVRAAQSGISTYSSTRMISRLSGSGGGSGQGGSGSGPPDAPLAGGPSSPSGPAGPSSPSGAASGAGAAAGPVAAGAVAIGGGVKAAGRQMK